MITTEFSFLEGIGLTRSEIKVYLALLKLGLSTKGKILREAKIAPSKIYHVMNKLIDKGLASIITKEGVKHFSAAPPTRIKDYINKKKEEINKQELLFEKVLNDLIKIEKQAKEETKVEVFIGWSGMETVYTDIVINASKRDNIYVFGAGGDPEEERLERFFIKYGRYIKKKKINFKIILDNNSRGYIKSFERKLNMKYNKKFLYNKTPSEVLIHKNKVAIVMRKSEPIITLITDKETADSFVNYFNELWKIATN